MKKTLLIIQQEYLKRVKKKSFILMTLLTPLLIAAIYAIPVYFAMQPNEHKNIQVIDQSGIVFPELKGDKEITYTQSSLSLDQAKKESKTSQFNAILFIPKDILTDATGIGIYAKKNIGLDFKIDLERAIEGAIKNQKLRGLGMDPQIIAESKTDIKLESFELTENQTSKKSSTEAATVIGYILGFVLYLVLFIYGTQVMRGVMEEKQNRIIEVIISSVKPKQLMFGKIIGLGLVGLTQFVIWIGLTITLSTGASKFLLKDDFSSKKPATEIVAKAPSGQTQSAEMAKATVKAKAPTSGIADIIESSIENLNWVQILINFIFYFLGGYLIYSSMFAAIGAAVDNETDTQQFMMPVMMPIIISFMLSTQITKAHDGQLAFWASMFPLTSPICMLVRLPFGVPLWELALSWTLLIITFVGITLLAARIYRVGILMYGKKPSFKELGKWIFYKA
jgi:ABC-2 type transport system permease protein